MTELKKINAFILAGGQSSRMGKDKALVNFLDKPMLQHAIDLVKPIFQEVFILSSSPAHSGYGLKCIPDQFANSGPLAALHSGLLASSSEWNFFLACDMPRMNTDCIEHLYNQLSQNTDAAIPNHKNGIEPLAAFYHRDCISVFDAQLKAGQYKIQEALKKIDVQLISIQTDTFDFRPCFQNFNTPNELE